MFRINENGIYRGAITFINAILNAGCVSNTQVKDSARIDATKLEHQHRVPYAQESATTAVSEAVVIHTVKGVSGTLQDFKAGVVVANGGAATVTVDLLKNGVSVLTSAITINNTHAAYELVEATFSDADVAADDVLEVSVTATAGGGTLGKGAFSFLDLHEDAV